MKHLKMEILFTGIFFQLNCFASDSPSIMLQKHFVEISQFPLSDDVGSSFTKFNNDKSCVISSTKVFNRKHDPIKNAKTGMMLMVKKYASAHSISKVIKYVNGVFQLYGNL